ncbi:MAG TPA: Rv3235 family protein [Trebonia sp.]|nr:Rv3235 family protein [Trebonia sp.]
MPAEQVRASLDPAGREESAIEQDGGEQPAIAIMMPPDLWPPPGLQPEAAPAPEAGTAAPRAAEAGPALPRQFAVLLAEVLTGVRPARQLDPWLSRRGSIHLHRLMPLFNVGHRPRVLRVLTSRPAPGVVEMTMIVVVGTRTRALAVRLEHAGRRAGEGQPVRRDRPAAPWRCTDIEAA